MGQPVTKEPSHHPLPTGSVEDRTDATTIVARQVGAQPSLIELVAVRRGQEAHDRSSIGTI